VTTPKVGERHGHRYQHRLSTYVFDRFRQADSTTTRSQWTWTRIGVLHLVELHAEAFMWTVMEGATLLKLLLFEGSGESASPQGGQEKL